MSSIKTNNESEAVNVLSCDASSIASLMSSIELVEELMRRVQKELGLPEPPKPCNYFKLMVRAKFSSLMVILFGRLAMSTEQVKENCINIMNEAFSERKLRGIEAFKRTKLRSAVEKMLTASGVGVDARMLEPQAVNAEGCKVMVCVSPVGGMRAGMPACLRTYSVDVNRLPDCTIVEAICATFAIPGLFKPVDVMEPGGVKSTYMGIQSFNPTAQLLDETVNVLPNEYMACVISLGAMQNETSAAECERVAREMSVRFMHQPGVYFRLCVSQGMETIKGTDWSKRLDGVVLARTYLQLVEKDAMISEAARVLAKGDPTVLLKHARGAIPGLSIMNHSIKQCPPPSLLFVGRQEVISALGRCLMGRDEGRRVCVLYGLGGVGKTQIALKIAENHRNDYRHIFYIDCTSKKTIDQDFKTIALAQKIGEFANDALTWLARLRESWLILYNNADDPSVNLRGYFPACSHGSILVTTRNHGMINLAHSVDAAHHIVQMTDDEAQELFAKASGAIEDVGSAGAELVNVIGCFPLAIVQAGAYIRTNMCTTEEYLEMYHSSRGQILEDYANEVQKADDYELTVYATWRVSYRQLAPLARQLFDVLAFMHHDHITEDIFHFAVLGLQRKLSPLPPTDEETRVEKKTIEFLEIFTRLVDKTWDHAAFLRIVNDLISYSLLTYDSANNSYFMHPLVQQWTRTVIADPEMMCNYTTFLLAWSVTDGDRREDYAHRRTLLSHIDALPNDKRLRPRLAWRFQPVYRESGRSKDEERLLEAVHEANVNVFGRHSQHSLKSMDGLAMAYFDQGRWPEAEKLQREVVEVGKQTWGSEHPSTLHAIGCLAVTYSVQGRWTEAEVLQRELVGIEKRMWGAEHQSTLIVMSNLAKTYWRQGRWKETEGLQLEVVEAGKQMWDSEHPYTLLATSNLAMTYSNQGRCAEAETLQREVFEVNKRVWGSEHPTTLEAMINLAKTYSDQERWAEAEILQREVLEVGIRVWGSEHPNTLAAMGAMGASYLGQGRLVEAEALQRAAVEAKRRLWGSEHPDTLQFMSNLAVTCARRGRWVEAETLQREVVEGGMRVWGNEHPYTLVAIAGLAETRSNQGHWVEAETLQQDVLERMKRVFGHEHPHTRVVMHGLAKTRYFLGQLDEARWLTPSEVGTQKHKSGNSSPTTIENDQMREKPKDEQDLRTLRVMFFFAILIPLITCLACLFLTLNSVGAARRLSAFVYLPFQL